ncbi:YeeE/YedE family protein [Uliginosibacterium sp. H3]|uniref:YeeE/YedE family protein n=1 Tax=Uliginosibacterium silvisoli TaxID=3114758 RepID=A0ABU6K7E5_9RHOO|nr:YeeE/YedE family protein [Uliginosibacterium sp. H3]
MIARVLAALAAGALFGLGLAAAQMTQPSKVLGFLDFAGAWDPSLLFVLGGAVTVTLVSFRFILRRKAPLFDEHFHLSTKTAIDPQLLIGSALFGIGWGISGYCPSPAIAALAAPNSETWIFLPAMLVGAGLQRWLASWRKKA